jgi:molecular chaperone DnaJ
MGFVQFREIGECPACRGKGIPRGSLCKNCRGTGYVKSKKKIKLKIPSGVDSGHILRLTGEGEPGRKGGSKGDMYFILKVIPHKVFKRSGDDIVIEVNINMPFATLGTEMEVPTLKGRAKLKIPKGTQPGTVFRLKNNGVPHLRRWGRGDQYVKVNVKTPTNLTGRQKELIKELAKEMDNEFHN